MKRNSVWLAERGAATTAVAVAMVRARALDILVLWIESGFRIEEGERTNEVSVRYLRSKRK